MIFALGVITGLLLAVLSIVVDIYLRKTGQPERLIQKLTEMADRQHAVIIKPKSQVVKTREEITKEYEDRGEEAPLIL